MGRDATRFFLAARAASSQLTFDINLALSASNDNPVYYVQYAHARACSVMRRLAELGWEWTLQSALEHLGELSEEHEKALLRQLDRSLQHAGVDTLRLSAEQPFAQTLQHFFELRRGRRRG